LAYEKEKNAIREGDWFFCNGDVYQYQSRMRMKGEEVKFSQPLQELLNKEIKETTKGDENETRN